MTNNIKYILILVIKIIIIYFIFIIENFIALIIYFVKVNDT